MGPKPLAQEVFEQFPNGVLVFDHSGELVAANKAARRFLGPLRRKPDGRAPRCCDLFGCETAGVLEDACLAKLAADATGPLPELRVDLASSAPADAVWLTTAPLGGARPHFLLEMRRAQSNDRRRRTQPHWMGEPRLSIFALGRTRVQSREGPIEGAWLEQRAGKLFKYLVCERRRAVYPEEMAGAIWPNEDAHTTGTVRYFVHRLRRQLEPEAPAHGPSSFIIASGGGYRLAPSVHVDADEFEDRVREGLAASSAGNPDTAAAQLQAAVALYGGDLIEDEPNASWVFDERERLRTLAEQALRHLLEMDLDEANLDSALGRLRRLVQLQPFDLRLHRQLLTLCMACGRRSEAMRRYSVLRARLRDEFSEDLDFQLPDLTSDAAMRSLDLPAVDDPTSGAAAKP